MKISAKSPCRVDLAGSALDIWPLYLYHPGAVTVNFAIDRYASCAVESRGDSKIMVRYFAPETGPTIGAHSEAPAGAGGGRVFFLAEPGAGPRVRAAVEREGACVLPARITPRGVQVRVSA